MTIEIEIVQRDGDKTDYLKLIVELLNKRFTLPESMELRWQLNCLDVAQELGGRYAEPSMQEHRQADSLSGYS